MVDKHLRGSLMRAGFAILVGCAALALSYSVSAQEITTGATVRSDNMTGSHWELTWYDEEKDWRWGATYTGKQELGLHKTCGSLGSLGPICYQRDLNVASYFGAYVQRMWRYKSLYAGLGVAVHEIREPLLSLPASFRTSVGYQFDRQWSIEWTHMSNARIKKPNWGQDLILIRYAW